MGNSIIKGDYVLCCDKGLAKYRCQIKIDDMSFFTSGTKDEDIIQKFNGIGNTLIKLKPFWKSTECNYDHDTVKFIACEKCIQDEFKDLFIYHQDGWTENIKCHYDYEERDLQILTGGINYII